MTTWNPSDKGAGITLSNGNLDVVGGAVFNSVRATTSRSSGKFYYELKVIATSSGQAEPGIADANEQLTTGFGSAPPGNGSGVELDGATGIITDGFFVLVNNNIPAVAINDLIGIAVDFGAGKLWFNKNGTYAASGNPVTGANPSCTFTASSTLFPACALAGSGLEKLRLVPSGTTNLPSGYSEWDTAATLPHAPYGDLARPPRRDLAEVRPVMTQPAAVAQSLPPLADAEFSERVRPTIRYPFEPPRAFPVLGQVAPTTPLLKGDDFTIDQPRPRPRFADWVSSPWLSFTVAFSFTPPFKGNDLTIDQPRPRPSFADWVSTYLAAGRPPQIFIKGQDFPLDQYRPRPSFADWISTPLSRAARPAELIPFKGNDLTIDQPRPRPRFADWVSTVLSRGATAPYSNLVQAPYEEIQPRPRPSFADWVATGLSFGRPAPNPFIKGADQSLDQYRPRPMSAFFWVSHVPQLIAFIIPAIVTKLAPRRRKDPALQVLRVDAPTLESKRTSDPKLQKLRQTPPTLDD